MSTQFIIDAKQELEGHWVARVREMPDSAGSGRTRAQAVDQARARALRTLADRLERGEVVPQVSDFIRDEETVDTSEQDQVAQTAAALAGQVWGSEDFSEWEEAGDGKAEPR